MRSNQDNNYPVPGLDIQDRAIKSLEEKLKKSGLKDTQNILPQLKQLRDSIVAIEREYAFNIQALSPQTPTKKANPNQKRIDELNYEKTTRIEATLKTREQLLRELESSLTAQEKDLTAQKKIAEKEQKIDDLIKMSELFKQFKDVDSAIASITDQYTPADLETFERNQRELWLIILYSRENLEKAQLKINKIKEDLAQITEPNLYEKLVSGEIQTREDIPETANVSAISSALADIKEQVNIVDLQKIKLDNILKLPALQVEFEELIKSIDLNREQFRIRSEEASLILENLPIRIRSEEASLTLENLPKDSVSAIQMSIQDEIVPSDKTKPSDYYTKQLIITMQNLISETDLKKIEEKLATIKKLRNDLNELAKVTRGKSEAVKYETENLIRLQEQSVKDQQKEFYTSLKATLIAHIPAWDKEHTLTGTSINLNGKSKKVPRGMGEILKIFDPSFEKKPLYSSFFKRKSVSTKPVQNINQDEIISNLLKFKEIAQNRLHEKSESSRDINSPNTQILLLLASLDMKKLNDPKQIKELNEKLISLTTPKSEISTKQSPTPRSIL